MSSMFGCAEVRELAPDLALGTLSGGERAEVLLHTNGCARCQAFVAELTDVADRLPMLAPEIEPPAGFGQATLALMTGARRRRRFRWAATIAATAAAAAILSVTIVRVTDSSTTQTAAPPPVTAPALRTVNMIGAGGHWAGDVFIAGEHRTTLRIEVSYAVPNGPYAIELSHGVSSPKQIGMVSVMDGKGEWSGPATLPSGTATVSLVDLSSGNKVCSASVGDAATSAT
jgi:hypothetical protein